jgi:DNA-binding MarR family transcriptional regulator
VLLLTKINPGKLNKVTQDTLSLLPWIGKTAKFIDYHVTDYMKEQGIDLSKEQFIVLKYLHDKDGLIQNDLAFITNRSKTALTRLIQTMEKKNLVYRKSSPTDLRVNHVFLTDHGREVWKTAYPHFRMIDVELQKGISTEALKTVRETLEKIQQNLKIRTHINQKIQ